MKQLFSMKIFWILFLMMLSAGASEQAVSQWASTFAERGLGVSKTVGMTWPVPIVPSPFSWESQELFMKNTATVSIWINS